MDNKNKALTNYIVGITMIVITIIVSCALFINDSVGSIGSDFSQPAAAGITFGSSLIIMLITYLVVTLVFADKDKLINLLLPILLSIIAAAAVITLVESSYYGIFMGTTSLGFSDKLWIKIILTILLTPSFIMLILLLQIYITKILLTPVASDRAAEWEIDNFILLIKNKLKVEHKDNYSIFTKGEDKYAVKFISDDRIERKIIIEGETKDLIVKEFEKNIEGCKDSALVYLSNEIPGIIGKSDRIKVIRNSDLDKFFKGVI